MTAAGWVFGRLAAVAAGVLCAIAVTAVRAGDSYDLAQTGGMNCFAGSAEAKKVLAAQGFVVAAPTFAQIFQPYIKSPLPVFVTPDSAWHTYHILLEEGVAELERSQSARLAEFSLRLLRAATAEATNEVPEFAAIAQYASLGLAFQDEAHRATLSGLEKRLIDRLLTGTEPESAPIGFPLSPVQFRPQSFYAESADLRRFYSARQWYSCVDFRLSDTRETELALYLAWLVERTPELRTLWEQLSRPYDALLAPPEDGTVTSYNQATREALRAEVSLAGLRSRLTDIQKRLASDLPNPSVNDQSLNRAEYENFARNIKGFRLLPGRQLPCAVCFQATVDPKIPGRMFPSGLDFMAASPELRSAAAQRALEAQFGHSVAQAIEKTACPRLPDSLYGRSMQLLAKLQEPLPSGVPQPLRTEAWADLQLWTQLAAWSEQRHTWALYAKNPMGYMGDATPPPGVVAPYPGFFAGLAELSRATAKAFEIAAAEQPFDAKALAAELYELENRVRSYDGTSGQQDFTHIPPKIQHFSRFIDQFYARHRSELTNARALHAHLDEMLKRVAETGQANAAEKETLRLYYDTRAVSAPALSSFARVCDRLTDLARKQLAGQPLNQDDADWVRDYGKAIAAFHGYLGNSWLAPLDDFSLVTRIFDNPLVGSVLYAGVGRPQSLYVILPYKGKPQLYRGAVLSYREFVRPEVEPLDDNSWRELVKQADTPAPPPFTRSFLLADTPSPADREKARTAALPFKPGPKPAIKLAVKEVDLGPKPARWARHEGWIIPSDDCRHVAYRVRENGKWRIVRDGVSGREYDDVDDVSFTPDQQHLVYVVRAGDKWRVVRDGVEGTSYGGVSLAPFAEEGSRVIYTAVIQKGKECVVVDGVEGPVFDKIVPGSFRICQNGKHFAYAAWRGARAVVVKDTDEVMEADDVLRDEQLSEANCVFLSPEGKRFAAIVKRAGQWAVIVDGVASAQWDSLNSLNDPEGPTVGFSPDGRHFTYSANRGAKRYVVVDEAEHECGWVMSAMLSPAGEHAAFVCAEEKPGQPCFSHVVLDGVPGAKFKGIIEGLTFSPDGRNLAYRVRGLMADDYVVVQGGKTFEDAYSPGPIFFSPDSRHMAFLAMKYGQSFFIIDDLEYLKSDDTHGGDLDSKSFAFSPDGQRWAFTGVFNKKRYAIISGAAYGPYDYLAVPDEDDLIYFSPDSRHFAFMATRDSTETNYWGRQCLVVDGLEYEIQGSWLSDSELRFDSPTKLHGLVMGKERIYRLEAEILEK